MSRMENIRRVADSGPVEAGPLPGHVPARLTRGFAGLLSSSRRTVLSQPRRKLWLLLRLQIDAVVDALDRLPVGPLRAFYLVRGVKIRDLIAHVGVAERTGGAHDLGTGKWAAGFLYRFPVRQNKVPG